MAKMVVCILAALAVFGTGAVFAGGTAAEAEAMVPKALELIKSQGKDAAFTAFTSKAEGFVKDDLYIFVVQYDGLTVAHGGNDKLVGKNMKDLKDADGKLFIQAMIEKAQAGGGWVDYKWTNPETKKVQDKSTYVQPVEGMDAFIGCGIYK